MTVDVVIVAYESAATLRVCLESLPDDVSVTVVDNASVDGSADLADELGARVVRNRRNVGFAAAANEGARTGTAELILFLNPDAVLETADLRALVASFSTDPRLGAASPRLLRPDGSEQRSWWPVPSARETWLEALGLRRLKPVRPAGDGTVPYVVGTCLCIRRRSFNELGGFDERFWLYGEDADLGQRLADTGWRSRYVPEACARHVGGESGRRDPGRTFEHFQRGAEHVVAKHGGRAALVSHRLGLLVGSALRLPRLALRRDDEGRQRYATRQAMVARLVRVLLHAPTRVDA